MKLIKEREVVFDSEHLSKCCVICVEPMDSFETNKCDTCNRPICLDCKVDYMENCSSCIEYQHQIEDTEIYLSDWLKTA